MTPAIDYEMEDNISSGVGVEEEEESTSAMVNLRFYPNVVGNNDDVDDNDENHFEDDNDDVDVLINSGGILRKEKVVKFADDEAEKLDARRDKARNRQELLSKIARLTDQLKDTEKQLSVEKEKRKKKEKNLVKLAKELKKRNQKRENDLERIEEVRRCFEKLINDTIQHLCV